MDRNLGRSATALRHKMVLDLDLRSSVRGSGDAPYVSAEDTRLEETVGRMERRGSELIAKYGMFLDREGGVSHDRAKRTARRYWS